MPKKLEETEKEYHKRRKKEWYIKNREKILANKREKYSKNSENEKERSKLYRENNKEKILKYSRWYEKNKRKNTKERKLANNKLVRKHYQKNKAQYYNKAIQRRVKKRNVTPVWADQDKIKEIYKKCIELNKKAGFPKYHVDHIVPLKGKNVCGLHVENNLRVILAFENLSKGNSFE